MNRAAWQEHHQIVDDEMDLIDQTKKIFNGKIVSVMSTEERKKQDEQLLRSGRDRFVLWGFGR